MNQATLIKMLGLSAVVLLAACSAAAPTDFNLEELELVESEYPEGDVDVSGEALTSSVDCSKSTMTAYKNGASYKIQVVKVGSKRVSVELAHAFLKWQKAANQAGVTLKLVSGFRTNDEQKYFYSCYKNCNCNGCNPADPPGYSKHQSGKAIDVGTDNWTWVKKNAAKYGFQGIQSEKWHFIFTGSDPGGACSGTAQDSVCTPGEKRCGSDGKTVETCKPDGSGHVKSQTCSSSCSNGACSATCQPSWDCESWSNCDCGGDQTRACTDTNHCGTTAGKPSVSRTCDPCASGMSGCSTCEGSSGCTPDWHCSDWSTCSCSGTQTRNCSDDSSCGTSSGKPATSRSCDPCAGGAMGCAECSGSTCQYGATGENDDPCEGTAEQTWRCVKSTKFGTSVSQVCRDVNNDGHPVWVNYHLNPSNCDACCGSYNSGCAQ